jgi:hypothetical protein
MDVRWAIVTTLGLGPVLDRNDTARRIDHRAGRAGVIDGSRVSLEAFVGCSAPTPDTAEIRHTVRRSRRIEVSGRAQRATMEGEMLVLILRTDGIGYPGLSPHRARSESGNSQHAECG